MRRRSGPSEKFKGRGGHAMTMKPRAARRVFRHLHLFLLGGLCIAWFLLRTGTRPSRIVYPCQQASIAGAQLWSAVYLLPLVSLIRFPGVGRGHALAYLGVGILALALLLGALFFAGILKSGPHPDALPDPGGTSDIFMVNGTTGDDGGVPQLIRLMEREGTPFYATETGSSRAGMIAKDDVVLLKVNAQWDERGGTNTDLVKALIRAIVDHPDGFSGEIIVADNGQAQYGPAGTGGSLDFEKNNAEDRAQSIARVVGSFSGSHRVSTYLWDTITTGRVREYADGDTNDGYIVNDTPNPRTGIPVSYPKFTTPYGTRVSFKHGIWNATAGAYDEDRLKVVNVPVLKSHGTYGVSGAVKNYMGVPSDRLTAAMGSRAHATVDDGGMGTEMAETRFPVVTILDAIWINARSKTGNGPETPYESATWAGIIAASSDPVALDYWAAQEILMPAARSRGYTDLSKMDPENQSRGRFGSWLRLSMQELRRAGYAVTIDRSAMNVHVVENGDPGQGPAPPPRGTSP